MREFALLINALDSTNKANQKVEAILQFLHTAPEKDKLWLLALFTGRRPKRVVSTVLMRQWVQAIAEIPEWLFQECYAAVGDLGETIALLLPPPQGYQDQPLAQWMEQIIALREQDDEAKKDFVLHAWHNLPYAERFIFNKLLGGSFRVGVSSKILINALAQYFKIEVNTVAHSIMGEWSMEDVVFDDLIQGKYADTKLSKPYPFCLAYPIEQEEQTLAQLSQWQAEYKWDGIRGQVIKRDNEVFIWSRGEELVTDQFPELSAAFQQWEGNFVVDGEILAFAEGKILNFTALQKRLNRKSITKQVLAEIPVVLFVYDLLELEGEDCRSWPLAQRRATLEQRYQRLAPPLTATIQLPHVLSFTQLDDLRQLRQEARALQAEGLMLKRQDSIYHTGRKKGDWWKWKIDPYTLDAVLIYAQKGSGRRSNYYTDYTFAVRDGDKLVTLAKAYSGLTDKEIQEVSRFVNKNAVEKFGPVRTVKAELVFELAFEGIGWSPRHKSGVALRFPRIVRWRKDKTVADIDDLETIKKMIT